MFRRNETKTRGGLLRAELGESWDHALRAAGHAAGGVRATVGPTLAPAAERVRGVAASGWNSTRLALAPLTEAAAAQYQARNGRRRGQRGGKSTRRRWPMVAGLVAGGAVVGGATAYLVRRRRQQQQQWEEYQHSEPAAAGSTPSVGGPSGTGKVSGDPVPTATHPAEPVSGRASPGNPVGVSGTGPARTSNVAPFGGGLNDRTEAKNSRT